MASSLSVADSQLNRPKQLQYWKRCLKTYLPHVYTSNDCNRLTLAFFILSALDLLGELNTCTTAAERDDYIRWIYHNQHRDGGFRGSPATDLGDARRDRDNEHWDPANLPATFFALSSLLVLGDDLGRVKRHECLGWLPKLQRPGDGSFGETLGEHGRIEGGLDTRFGYCAAGVRWILRGSAEGEVDGVPDIDVDKLVRCIRSSETYDGGISEAAFHEAHAGFTYCAIGALSFLNRLPTMQQPPSPQSTSTSDDANLPPSGLSDPSQTVRWLVSRQTLTLDEEDCLDTSGDETDTASTCHDAHSFVTMSSFPTQKGRESYADRPIFHPELQWAGFNGRCNKIADTCYAWWVGASLSMLSSLHLTSLPSTRHYLLDKTQHLVGGFGKVPGDPPDIYHSYLGLASLALLREPGVKPIRAAACISEDACAWLETLSWRRRIVGLDSDTDTNAEIDAGTKTDGSAVGEAQREPAAVLPQSSSSSLATSAGNSYIALSGG